MSTTGTTTPTTTAYFKAFTCTDAVPQLLYVDKTQPCEGQVSLLNSVLGECGSDASMALTCDSSTISTVDAVSGGNKDQCEALGTVLGAALAEYEGPPQDSPISFGCAFNTGILYPDGGEDCGDVANRLNALTAAYVTDTFVSCERATPTTAQTSTVTTTPPTPTFECLAKYDTNMLSNDGGTRCAKSVAWIQRVLDSCEEDVVVACAPDGADDLFESADTDCNTLAASLTAVVQAAAGPDGDVGAFGCVHGKFLALPDDCSATEEA